MLPPLPGRENILFYRHSITTRIKTQRGSICSDHVLYSIVIPLQQGLRPLHLVLRHGSWLYSIVIPLQQGLRHHLCCPSHVRHTLFYRHSITTIFYRHSITTRIKTIACILLRAAPFAFYRHSITTRIKTYNMAFIPILRLGFYRHSITTRIKTSK